MRKVAKGPQAPELAAWKRRHPHTRYGDLNADVRRAIRRDCLAEQKGLCAFCCGPVAVDDGHNAHIQDQQSFPQHSLVWENIVASCCNAKHCGVYQERRALPLTPLMDECETEFAFYMSGTVKGLTPRAKQTLAALNLNADALKERRKQAIRALTDATGFQPIEDIAAWDAELIEAFMEACGEETDGTLPPYAPVLVNIARQYL